MNDPEFSRRKQATELLSPVCDCEERVRATLASGTMGEIDVLCRPKDSELSEFSLAVEVKAHQRVGDKELGPWLKQASDYVGAIPENGWPRVVASFVWLVGVDLHPTRDEQCRMAGMFQLAQHFRVGKIDRTKAGLTIVFGPSAEIYVERRGWRSRARELLVAKRIAAGLRRQIK